MKRSYLVFSMVLMSVLALSSASSAFAQPSAGINATSAQVATNIGVISSIEDGVAWTLNLFAYFGWAGVIIGVGLAIFALIYKLIQSDSDEAMKAVQGYLTKAVLIVVAGILLIGASFIINTVRKLFGTPTNLVTPDNFTSKTGV